MNRTLTLLLGDLKNITRDSMLMLVMVAPLLILGLMRFGVPQISILLSTQLQFDLSPYYQLLTIFFCALLPMLFGLIIGFLMLDEKDEHILQFITVTPLTRQGYLAIKFIAPAVSIFLFVMLFVELSGLVQPEIFRLIPLAILLAAEAPMTGMFLVGFAENKVEGLAIGKGLGIFFFAPVAGFFIQSPLQYIAGVSPVFWVSEAYLAPSATGYILNILGGIVVHVILFLLLLRKFNRKIMH